MTDEERKRYLSDSMLLSIAWNPAGHNYVHKAAQEVIIFCTMSVTCHPSIENNNLL